MTSDDAEQGQKVWRVIKRDDLMADHYVEKWLNEGYRIQPDSPYGLIVLKREDATGSANGA